MFGAITAELRDEDRLTAGRHHHDTDYPQKPLKLKFAACGATGAAKRPVLRRRCFSITGWKNTGQIFFFLGFLAIDIKG